LTDEKIGIERLKSIAKEMSVTLKDNDAEDIIKIIASDHTEITRQDFGEFFKEGE
jgi:Ca2+-binding EF-hand superfamily protein